MLPVPWRRNYWIQPDFPSHDPAVRMNSMKTDGPSPWSRHAGNTWAIHPNRQAPSLGSPQYCDSSFLGWLILCLLWSSVSSQTSNCQGQELVLEPLHSTGQLRWTPLEGIHLYSVEWAPTTEGPWYPDWSNLVNLQNSGTNSMSVDIPMFFRVRAVTNATLTNWVGLPDTSHLNVADGTEFGQTAGPQDGSDSTTFGASRFRNADGTTACEVTSTHTWKTPIVVQRLRAKVSANPQALGNFPKHRMRFELLLRQNGEWRSVYLDDTGDQAGTGVETIRSIEMEKLWTNITGIRVIAHAEAYSFSGNRRQEVAASVYEVEAWGY